MATPKVFCQSMYASAHFRTEQLLSYAQVRAFARHGNGTVVAPAVAAGMCSIGRFTLKPESEHADPTGFGGLFRRRRMGAY
jgi:hypothetical protein